MIIETEHKAQKEHDYQNLKGLNSPPQISGSVRAEPQPKDLAKSLPVPCCSVKLHRRHWFEVFCLDRVLCHEAKPQSILRPFLSEACTGLFPRFQVPFHQGAQRYNSNGWHRNLSKQRVPPTVQFLRTLSQFRVVNPTLDPA